MVTPLRKRKISGALYTRRPEVEQKIAELLEVSTSELVERAKISSDTNPGFISSECILHFMRATRTDNRVQSFDALFRVLRERVLRQLPRPDARQVSTTAMTPETIRDDVFGRFVELVSADRASYEEKLDFFEIQFDLGVARLRRTAREKAHLHENRSTILDRDEDSGELSPEVERAAAAFNHGEVSKIDDQAFRSRLEAAIDTLPPMQCRIVHMSLKDIPIDSKVEGQITISRILNKSEKTIRNHRAAALAKLRHILSEGEG